MKVSTLPAVGGTLNWGHPELPLELGAGALRPDATPSSGAFNRQISFTVL
jgi:hypothetical protein